jgi:hypothetical protein
VPEETPSEKWRREQAEEKRAKNKEKEAKESAGEPEELEDWLIEPGAAVIVSGLKKAQHHNGHRARVRPGADT